MEKNYSVSPIQAFRLGELSSAQATLLRQGECNHHGVDHKAGAKKKQKQKTVYEGREGQTTDYVKPTFK